MYALFHSFCSILVDIISQMGQLLASKAVVTVNLSDCRGMQAKQTEERRKVLDP